jgi:alkaline phosphatase
MVPVFAGGPGAGKFNGIRDNTELHHRIIKILGL